MGLNEELNLLIQSKYPVVFFESIDEVYALRQLKGIAGQLGLDFYQWSLTDGLKRGDNDSAYYLSKEPVKALRTILDFFSPAEGAPTQPGLFVLKDFDKYLEDPLTLRLFKDAINKIKNSKNTFVILSAEYKLPKEIEPDSAHLVGGYPTEEEIGPLVKETYTELRQSKSGVTSSINTEEFKKIISALKGLSAQQIRSVINQCVAQDSRLDIKDLEIIETYKKKVFDQEGLLEFCLSEDKDNIAGFVNLKRWLEERQDCFHANCGLPAPKGLLLMGVQGCGKSLAAKIIAREFNLPLYRLDLSRLYSKYIGETEQNLRKALGIVEKLCPSCLWIDEIEKGFASSSGDIDGGVSQRILGTFLTWTQERATGCFLIATANNVYQLPPELLRKGRFDEIFFVDLPDTQTREELFKIHLKHRALKPEDFDLKLLAQSSADFSGAEIEQAIISALYRASSEKETITTRHILEQVQSTKPLSALKSEEITSLRSWAKERTIPV